MEPGRTHSTEKLADELKKKAPWLMPQNVFRISWCAINLGLLHLAYDTLKGLIHIKPKSHLL